MFKNNNIERIVKSTTIAGVELFYNSNGDHYFNVSVLKKEKLSINTVVAKEKLENITAVKEELNSSIPLCLVINGKGIIHKKVTYLESDDDKTLLQKALPNANIDDFYVQVFKMHDNNAYVSIVRKNIVDELVQQLINHKFSIINCILGPFSIQALIPLLENKSDNYELTGDSYQFTVRDLFITEYQPIENNNASVFAIGNEHVKASQMVVFSAAFQYFLNTTVSMSMNVPAIIESKEEFRQKNLFRFAGTALLGFFLVILMINFFMFSHFNEKKNNLVAKISLNQDILNRYEKLKSECTDKQNFFEKNGLLHASRTSYYADQLALDMPPAIRLTELDINPLVKKINQQENELTFTPKIIHIGGSCKRSIEVNEWLKTIREKKWIKEATLANYTQDKEKEIAEFSIELKIKN